MVTGAWYVFKGMRDYYRRLKHDHAARRKARRKAGIEAPHKRLKRQFSEFVF